jgi:hypothetical protein
MVAARRRSRVLGRRPGPRRRSTATARSPAG